MGVPGSNPGGPIIFRRKIEGCQSNPAGGERGLGQGWVCGGQYPGGPIIFRRKIEGGQSHPAGGERRLGRGKVGGGPISRRPDEFKGILTSSY